MSDPLALAARNGLPDDLLWLLEKYPRSGWDTTLGELGRFWLGRHAMFREAQAVLMAETEAFAEGRTGPERFGPRFHRIAGFLLGELHGHHQIEDMHYFPRLAAMEPSLQRGFDLLDADHHALHDALDAGAAAANATLAALKGPEARTEAARTRDAFAGLARLLDRHLADEEDIVAPLLAHRGEDAFR
jgi:hypothetical protein